jgi:hypothetical protein
MARIFINHPVSDYDKWRPAFDADKPGRAAAGLVDVAVRSDSDNPNSIWIVGEGERDSAERMLQNPELGKLMGRQASQPLQSFGWRRGNRQTGARRHTYPTTKSTSWTGSSSPNTCAQPPRVSMYSRIRHTLPWRTSYTKQ